MITAAIVIVALVALVLGVRSWRWYARRAEERRWARDGAEADERRVSSLDALQRVRSANSPEYMQFMDLAKQLGWPEYAIIAVATSCYDPATRVLDISKARDLAKSQLQ